MTSLGRHLAAGRKETLVSSIVSPPDGIALARLDSAFGSSPVGSGGGRGSLDDASCLRDRSRGGPARISAPPLERTETGGSPPVRLASDTAAVRAAFEALEATAVEPSRGLAGAVNRSERMINMAISVGFRSIASGAVANGGEDIVLHAKADDAEANVFLPADEAPRLAILLLQLSQIARDVRSHNGPIDIPILEGEALEVVEEPTLQRKVLQIRLASDTAAQGANAAILRLSLPPDLLSSFAESILRPGQEDEPVR